MITAYQARVHRQMDLLREAHAKLSHSDLMGSLLESDQQRVDTAIRLIEEVYSSLNPNGGRSLR